jgi:steroid 5-alpha reductase family enzyme
MSPLLQISIFIFAYMVFVFFLALAKKDNSIVDIFWGLGFVIIAGFSLFSNGHLDLHKVLMDLLVIIWGRRLTAHILARNRGRGEDFRYKAWRDTWKHFVLRSFFQIFMLQGLFMLIIASPVYFVNFAPTVKFSFTDYLGFAIFVAGFIFEAVGDYQLKLFKKDPANKGKLMTKGLWSITRHPNYFGESLIWWGIAFFALDYPTGWITLISPVLLTLLLRFVSGVPMLEQKYKGRPDWEEYKMKTATFVPFIKFL